MLPYFFQAAINAGDLLLDEATSKHVINVLRMQKGEKVLLTDGKGKKSEAVIVDDNRKRCVVSVSNPVIESPSTVPVTIAVSLLKNAARFEWFLEKATEIGISEIIPLLCERTEKEKFRQERLTGIVTSAMLQSQQCWMPVLHEPVSFENAVKKNAAGKFIAHCASGEKKTLQQAVAGNASRLLLIGPEGDFTDNEIAIALENDFMPVTLGDTRLRTETAALVAAALLKNL